MEIFGLPAKLIVRLELGNGSTVDVPLDDARIHVDQATGDVAIDRHTIATRVHDPVSTAIDEARYRGLDI